MADSPLTPSPATRRGDEADAFFGVTVTDPYRWLEDGDSAEVAEWVAAHNRITREALDARPTRSRWHERLSALTALPTTLALKVAGDHLFVLERPAAADQYLLTLRSAIDPTVPGRTPVSYTHLRAHETVLDIVCRLLLAQKQHDTTANTIYHPN